MDKGKQSGGMLLRATEVAEELGISRALAYSWMASGILPVVKIPGSRTVRVPRPALLQWVERQTRGGDIRA